MAPAGNFRRRALAAALIASLACGATLPAGKSTDVNARQDDGSTALLWAVYEGDADRVGELLEAGAGRLRCEPGCHGVRQTDAA